MGHTKIEHHEEHRTMTTRSDRRVSMTPVKWMTRLAIAFLGLAACSSSSGAASGADAASCSSPTGSYSLTMTFDAGMPAACSSSDASITMQILASGAVTIAGAPKATILSSGKTVGPPVRCAIDPTQSCLAGGCPSESNSLFVVDCDGGPSTGGEAFFLCVDPSGNIVPRTGAMIDVDYDTLCAWHLTGRRS